MARSIVAIVGRPNVGKSSLFNRLIGERRAVTHDLPGTTRDRLYGSTDWTGREFTLVDTGGIGLELDDVFLPEVVAQAGEAIDEADVIVFLLDAQSGLSAADAEVANRLRQTRKPVIVVANKVENRRTESTANEFYELGLGDPMPLSAIQGTGTGDLLDAIVASLPPEQAESETAEAAVAVAIVGRPNVGKSSLLNAITGRHRAIVSPIPGTTRDPVDSLVDYEGQRILLIDTAGIRRRGRIARGVEQFSVLRAVRAIERSDVVALLIDATEGVTAQDTHVAGYIQEAARGLIVVVNKWDLVEKETGTAEAFEEEVRRALNFALYAPVVFLSALTGQRVRRVLDLALQIQEQRQRRIPTSELNEAIREAFSAHRVTRRGKALKVYYSTQAEVSPPTFVLFVNDPTLVHFSYQRYVENRLRDAFGFEGTAIRLVFRGRGEEPR